MDLINEAVALYQEKIGAYDKQFWEKSVDQRVRAGFHNVPKKSGRVKSELIDVDLVRGSTFTRAKPQHGWFQVTLAGLIKVIFMPLYIRWWQQHTSGRIGLGLLVLYAMQVFTLGVYYTSDASLAEVEVSYPQTSKQAERKWLQSLSIAHLCIPIGLMVVLGIVHAHIVSSSESHSKQRRGDSDRVRPSKSQKKVNILTDDSSQSSRKTRDAERNVDNKSEASTSLTGSTCRRRHVIHNSATVVTAPVNRGQSLTESAEWRKNGWVPEPSPYDDPKEGSTGVIEGTEAPPGVVGDEPRRCYSVNNRISTGDCGYEANGEKQDCDDEIYDAAESEDVVLTGNALEDDGMLDHPIAAVTGEILLPLETEGAVTSEIKLGDSIETCKLNDCCLIDKHEVEQNVSATANDNAGESCCADTSRTEDVAPPLGHAELQKSGCICSSHSAENTAGTYQDADFLACSESGGFTIGASGEMEYQPDAWVNNVDAHSRNGPTIFVKQPSECADDHRCSEERKLYESTRQSPRLSGVQSQPGRRRVSKTAYQRSQETLAQGIRAHPKLEVRSYGAKENLGISSAESDGELTPNAPDSPRVLTSELDWDDTMHSEVGCSTDTSSNATPDSDESETNSVQLDDEQELLNVQHASSVMKNLASNTDKVSCMIWEGEEVKKIDLTILDLGWAIIERVNKIPEVCDYLMLAVAMVTVSMSLPVVFRLYHTRLHLAQLNYWSGADVGQALAILFGSNWRQTVIIVNGVIQRMCLSFLFYFLMCVAERTFKQRFLYAKYFAYLTSCRRAKKSELPHFRLNKVRNIKMWLSLRSYLKKRGPQRSVDAIVSFAFLVSVMLVSYMCVELLQDSGTFLEHLSNWELMLWCLAVGLYVLRFMTLGTKINRKYRNFSVLITEQINLYLHMEQKPHKKEELMLANNVLKLAEALLKELESPFKISGLSANPYLYNITKVVILSAFSAVLTELLGFKLKLYKIKIRG